MLTEPNELRQASRAELIEYLEARGFACYDDESTELLREAALEDAEEGEGRDYLAWNDETAHYRGY